MMLQAGSVAWVAGMLFPLSAGGPPPKQEPPTDVVEAPGAVKIAQRDVLAKLLGEWQLEVTETPADGAAPVTTSGYETVVWACGDRAVAIEREVESSSGKLYGHVLLTWNPAEECFHGYVLHTTFPGPAEFKGTFDEANDAFTFRVNTKGADGSTETLVVETRFIGRSRRVTTYTKEGAAEPFKRIVASRSPNAR